MALLQSFSQPQGNYQKPAQPSMIVGFITNVEMKEDRYNKPYQVMLFSGDEYMPDGTCQTLSEVKVFAFGENQIRNAAIPHAGYGGLAVKWKEKVLHVVAPFKTPKGMKTQEVGNVAQPGTQESQVPASVDPRPDTSDATISIPASIPASHQSAQNSQQSVPEIEDPLHPSFTAPGYADENDFMSAEGDSWAHATADIPLPRPEDLLD